jgi:hypothetical protein
MDMQFRNITPPSSTNDRFRYISTTPSLPDDSFRYISTTPPSPDIQFRYIPPPPSPDTKIVVDINNPPPPPQRPTRFAAPINPAVIRTIGF